MNRFRASLVLWLVVPMAGYASSVSSSPITYSFTTTATSGPLAGTSSTGMFTIDSSIVIANGFANGPNLFTDLQFVWDGISYDTSSVNTVSLSFNAQGQMANALFGTNCTSNCSIAIPNTENWYVNAFKGFPTYQFGFQQSYAIGGIGSGQANLSDPVYMPVQQIPGTFQFSFPTINCVYPITTPCLIDPAAATGYEYTVGSGDPTFASVMLPFVGGNSFTLAFLESGQLISTQLAAGTQYVFPQGGVSTFRVTGIDPDAGINPNDTAGFVTALTFTAPGTFTGTMAAITQLDGTVSEPATLALLGIGLGGAGLVRRRTKSAHSCLVKRDTLRRAALSRGHQSVAGMDCTP